jgi:hypothetical protein
MYLTNQMKKNNSKKAENTFMSSILLYFSLVTPFQWRLLIKMLYIMHVKVKVKQSSYRPELA